MMQRCDSSLSVRKQCALLGLHRSAVYRRASEPAEDTVLANEIYGLWLESPFYGYRRVHAHLVREGQKVNHKRIQRLMQQMNLKGMAPGPLTSAKGPGVTTWPCLLKGLTIERVNQVWVTDITYLRVPSGFIYLVALMDLYSRLVVSYRVSVTMDVEFCQEMINEAITVGRPEIFHSDQGSQFTSGVVQGLLQARGIRCSMTEKGRCIDNVYVERFWRSLKYEDMMLRSYETVREARLSIKKNIEFYNRRRVHQALEYQTPEEVYTGKNQKKIVPFTYQQRSKRANSNNEMLLANNTLPL